VKWEVEAIRPIEWQIARNERDNMNKIININLDKSK
jgi:hypothetical protein